MNLKVLVLVFIVYRFFVWSLVQIKILVFLSFILRHRCLHISVLYLSLCKISSNIFENK